MQYDILYVKVEVVNNVDFVIYSTQLVKLNDVSHNNAEIPGGKPFLHEAVDRHEFQINYSFKKTVSGSHHQGNLKYGETAGMQCTSNAFFTICFSVIKSISIWKSLYLDYILDQGEQLIKSLNVNHPLAADELTLFVKLSYLTLN